MMYVRQETEKGFALLLAIIVSSVVLAIGVSILKISVNQVALSTTARESEFAFQAAHAGVDCMTYWRNEKATEYTEQRTTSEFVAASTPSIHCFGFGTDNDNSFKLRLVEDGASGTIDQYYYQFDWGSPLRCTKVRLAIINAYAGDFTIEPNLFVGNTAEKICTEGTVCSVVVSDGYNRTCSEVGTSIYSVQREITQEF